MTKDTFKTDVIFRKEKDGEILALFPYVVDTLAGDVMSYAHLGQHGAASYNYCIRKSKPAKPEEYKDLFAELESLGYNLRVIKRQSGRKYSEAYLSMRSNN
jgi:hypothetical protein